MRLFIAIELDSQVKRVLTDIQLNLKDSISKGNYTSSDNFHITLRFIGEVNEDEAEKLKKAIDDTVQQIQPFTLYLGGLGHFPRKNKEIIWVGVKGQAEKLFKLKEQLETELEVSGFSKEEQDYIPHITMVRQALLEKGFDEIKADLRVPEEKIAVKSLSLMESKRVEGDLVYTAIHKRDFH
ncbi:2'-5' RNA ligase [Alkalibacterium putridalgicola]|uniref:RNA 2',3'-cyclic phosphodiesterase n=1 Tax=Alkalibacterium putridalgicola TaxID=426703 RepID=A0A1H7TLM6_9LACT|nr:RNA 2',3'-cyclic phosphodiesterase [Alkalibacterium putridalgicola]GEK88228.1 RNA 2',3'-cyclic phosphodiesterase [Alkalibacterium putridalgicola]SEL85399.1 2'-5' RNA ligase [Alkalibacterium putridalgicola]